MADSFPDLGSNTTTFMRRPNWIVPLKEDFLFTKRLITVLGVTQIWTETTKVPRRYKMRFDNLTKTDEKELLDFILARQGQVKGFWMPSWHHQFNPEGTIVGGSFVITLQNEHFHIAYNGHEYIMLLLTNGDVIVRKIVAAEIVDESSEAITLDTAMDRTVTVDEIDCACLFLYARFDAENFEMSYTTDATSYLTLPIIELTREYP